MHHPQRLFTLLYALLFSISNVAEHATLPLHGAGRLLGALPDCIDFLTNATALSILNSDSQDNHEAENFLLKWQIFTGAQALVHCQFHGTSSPIRETAAGLNLVVQKLDVRPSNIQLGKAAIIYEQPESYSHNSHINQPSILSSTSPALSPKSRFVASTAHRRVLDILSDVTVYRSMHSVQETIEHFIEQWETPKGSDDETSYIRAKLLVEVKDFYKNFFHDESFTMESYALKSEGNGPIAFHKTLVVLGVLTGLTSLLYACRSFFKDTRSRLESTLGAHQYPKRTTTDCRIPVLSTMVRRSPISKGTGAEKVPDMKDPNHSSPSSLRRFGLSGQSIKPTRRRVRDLFDLELAGSNMKTTPVEGRIPVLPRAPNASIRKRASGEPKRAGAVSIGWKFAEDLSSS